MARPPVVPAPLGGFCLHLVRTLQFSSNKAFGHTLSCVVGKATHAELAVQAQEHRT